MTVEARLKKLLMQFGDPVENAEYNGKSERYYTFNISTHGTNYADDMPQEEIVMVQIHFFAPRNYNYVSRIRNTKVALANEGFLWPEMTDASDSEGRHVILETSCVQGGGYDGENVN